MAEHEQGRDSFRLDLDDTLGDQEVEFAAKPRGSGLETAEIWKAKYLELERQMSELKAAVSAENHGRRENQQFGSSANRNSFSNDNTISTPVLTNSTVPSAQARENALDALSKPIFQKLLPREFSGMNNDDPVAFVRALRKLLRLHPLPLGDFLILINTLFTGRAARWLTSTERTVATVDKFFEMFNLEFISKQYVQSLKRDLANEFQRDSETVY